MGGGTVEMSPEERREVATVLHDELVRGWIPRRADVEAVLGVIRSSRSRASERAYSSSPSW